MASKRSWVFILCMLAGISLTISRLRSPSATSLPANAQLVTYKEDALSSQLKQKGEEMLLHALGKPSHLTVTVSCSSGYRRQYLKTFPNRQAGKFGYAVNGIQQKSESYCKRVDQEKECIEQEDDAKSNYQQKMTSEKREYSNLQAETQERLWIERITVCAVVPCGQREELEEALCAALGLDVTRGDQVRVTLKQ